MCCGAWSQFQRAYCFPTRVQTSRGGSGRVMLTLSSLGSISRWMLTRGGPLFGETLIEFIVWELAKGPYQPHVVPLVCGHEIRHGDLVPCGGSQRLPYKSPSPDQEAWHPRPRLDFFVERSETSSQGVAVLPPS